MRHGRTVEEDSGRRSCKLRMSQELLPHPPSTAPSQTGFSQCCWLLCYHLPPTELQEAEEWRRGCSEPTTHPWCWKIPAGQGPQCCNRNKPAPLCSVTGEPNILASSHVLKLLPGFQLPKYQSINSLLSSFALQPLGSPPQPAPAAGSEGAAGAGRAGRKDRQSPRTQQGRTGVRWTPQLSAAACQHPQEAPSGREAPGCWGRTRNKWKKKGILGGCMEEWADSAGLTWLAARNGFKLPLLQWRKLSRLLIIPIKALTTLDCPG